MTDSADVPAEPVVAEDGAATAPPPTEQARQFAEALFPIIPEGLKVLVWVAPENESYWVDDAAAAAATAVRLSVGRDVYVGPGLSRQDFGPHHRCKAADVAGLVGLWADVDVKGPTHKQGAESMADALALAARFPLPPTVLVDSGTGLHAWWLFNEPWVFEDDAERDRAVELVALFGNTLEFYARARKFSVRGTFDLSRVMRFAGTVNQCKGKADPRPCAILEIHPQRRYEPDDFRQYLRLEADDGIDDVEPVQVGKLLFDPEAQPPAEKFQALCESNPVFVLSWENRRTNLRDASQSAFDMSVAAFAALAGWGEQEICDLIIAHRREHGADLKLGQPCYGITIGKAMAHAQARRKKNEEALEAARVAVEKAVRLAKDSREPAHAFDAAAHVAALPTGEQENAIHAFREALGRDLSVRRLRKEIAAKAKGAAPRKVTTKLPIIQAAAPLREVASESLRVLTRSNLPPRRFLRFGVLSRVSVDEKGRHAVAVATEAFVRGELAREAAYVVLTEKHGEVEVHPPLEVVRDILARDPNVELVALGEPPLPFLEGIVETPIIRPDGTILATPGYDPATGLFYAPAAGLRVPHIPDRPTRGDVQGAVALLNEAVGDFPYETEADRANTLGTVITPAVRQAVGLSPVCLLDAPQAGTGKSLLASAIYAIATGRLAAMTSAPEADEEWRKLITSLLVEGATMVIIDNVDGTLSAASLAKAITSPTWNDRILGSTRTVTVPQLATWIATGNNMAVGGDMARRCYRVRLNARSARPWKDGRRFRHPELVPWVLENRGRLIAAVLTLCRAWHAAGRPQLSLPVLGSFEAWSRTVGGILAFAGVKGFLSNVEELYEQADEDGPQWERFLAAWHQKYGEAEVTLSKLEDAIPQDYRLREALPDALAAFIDKDTRGFETVFKVRDPGRFKIRLGKQLRHRIDRRYGEAGLYVSQGLGDSHAKVATWRVRSAGSAGEAGFGGSVLPTPADGNDCGAQAPAHDGVCVRPTNNSCNAIGLDTPRETTHLPPLAVNGNGSPPGEDLPEDDYEQQERAALADPRTH